MTKYSPNSVKPNNWTTLELEVIPIVIFIPAVLVAALDNPIPSWVIVNTTKEFVVLYISKMVRKIMLNVNNIMPKRNMYNEQTLDVKYLQITVKMNVDSSIVLKHKTIDASLWNDI